MLSMSSLIVVVANRTTEEDETVSLSRLLHAWRSTRL